MSDITVVNSTANQAHFDYDVTKIFVWNNRYSQGSLLNASGAQKTFLPGTLLGRIAATGKLVPCSAAAVDGSQFPVGVLKTNVTLANAAEDTVNYCVSGDVEQTKLIFVGAETLESIVTVQDSVPDDTSYARRLKDLIEGMGIKLVACTELTGFDNQ